MYAKRSAERLDTDEDIRHIDALNSLVEADLADIDAEASRYVLTIHTDTPTLQGQDTGITFLDTEGKPVDPRSVTPRSQPGRICRDSRDAGLVIDERTTESKWLGDPCDYDTWIMALIATELRAAREASVEEMATAA